MSENYGGQGMNRNRSIYSGKKYGNLVVFEKPSNKLEQKVHPPIISIKQDESTNFSNLFDLCVRLYNKYFGEEKLKRKYTK